MIQRTLLVLVFILTFAQSLFCQKTEIRFESNDKFPNKVAEAPFSRFIGEWTLKDDTWIQNWGGTNDTLTIPGHHTLSTKINTDWTLLSIVDGPEPNGHIFWTYNEKTGEVQHLSSFGSSREGVGSGSIYGEGNLRLKISFSNEAPGTYRIYTYEWVNKDEYQLRSVQFDANDEASGLFYQGRFVRLNSN